ncbi:hypothetical protein [Lysinibacillus capsici]|nr:hypothetical protein [Lysinibacillus capsici]
MNLLGKILTTVIGTVGIRSSNSCEYLSIETAQKMAQAETSNNAYQIQNLINKHLMSSYNISLLLWRKLTK